MQDKHRLSALTAVVIMAIFLAIRLIFPPIAVWSYDVFGYHLYLPALVNHQDMGLKDIAWVEEMNERYGGSPSLYQVKPLEGGKHLIRFSPGMSIMNAPFFMAGHLVALLTPYEEDGFSSPYQWAIILAGLFYILAGIWILRKALLAMFADRTTAVSLVLLFGGSSLFFFFAWGNPMPHLYLFTLYAAILWLTITWHQKPTTGKAILLGLLTGLAMISRPSETLLLLLPLLWGIKSYASLRDKMRMLWLRKKDVIFFGVFLLVALLPQLLYWKSVTGQWIFNSYDDPQSGFDFNNPRIGYVLFGFRKGLFVYSPMMIFAALGLYYLYKNKREYFLAVLLFFLANVYLVACYSSLVSYGWRVFVQSHAVLAIPLACFAEWGISRRKIIRRVLGALLILIILLNVFKSYQVLRKIIDGSRMTRQAYFGNFFVINPKKADKSLYLVERSEESIESIPDETNLSNRPLAILDFEIEEGNRTSFHDTSIAFSGNYSYRMDSLNIWSPSIEIPYREITDDYYAWLRASVWVYREETDPDEEVLLVIHFNYKEKPYKYRTTSLKGQGKETSPGQWYQLRIDYMTPEVRTLKDPVKVYAWYKGKNKVFIDKLSLELFEEKDQ